MKKKVWNVVELTARSWSPLQVELFLTRFLPCKTFIVKGDSIAATDGFQNGRTDFITDALGHTTALNSTVCVVEALDLSTNI